MSTVTDFELRDALHLSFLHSTDAMVITNTQGIIVDVNPSFTRIYGYTQAEARGKTNAIVRSSHTTDAFYKRMWADIRNPQIGFWKGEIYNRCKDGTEIPALLTITPYKHEGKIAGYMGISVCIEAQKELHERLIQHEKMVSLGLMLAGVAHEIGNPLTSISSIVQMLQRKVEEPFVGEKLALIREHIDRITHVIRDLMESAHVNSDVTETVSVRDCLTRALELVRFHPQVRYLSVVMDVSDKDSYLVVGSATRLQQVFTNILINAGDAMDGKGQVLIRFKTQNGFYQVDFLDEGSGFTAKSLEHAFDPLFTTKSPGKGTGLGLYICQNIVRAQSGAIHVSNRPDGKGAQVSVWLPIKT